MARTLMQMRIIINTFLFLPAPLSNRDRDRRDRKGAGSAPTAGQRWPEADNRRALVTGLCLLSVTGCSTVPPAPAPTAEQACLDFYQALDQAVADAGVRDAGARVVPGFPYLRVDRFLADYRDRLNEREAYQSWLEAAADMDLAARRLELANLPPDRHLGLAEQGWRPPERELVRCSRLLRRQPAFHSERHTRLLLAAKVPDNYLTWQRVVGLYPLAEPFARLAIERLHQRLTQPFLELPTPRGRLQRYLPQSSEALAQVAARLQGSGVVGTDPLGVPRVSETMLDDLFVRFAPELEVDTRSDADRIGRIHWSAAGQALVDTADATAYRYISYTHFRGKALLQLNYLFWFPARDTGDIYAGHLDALLWRVTLDRRFQPLAYDSIHGCGCYYHLFPASGYRLRDTADAAEPVLSPLSAPALKPSQRIALRLASATHYLQGVEAVTGDSHPGTGYTVLEYNRLRALPLPGGGHRSLFGENGLVPGSERPERFLFWPFGVPSAGAMRQPGTHAIAFVGRRHFDEPNLLEKLIEKAP